MFENILSLLSGEKVWRIQNSGLRVGRHPDEAGPRYLSPQFGVQVPDLGSLKSIQVPDIPKFGF
jgi:hypothetical protein